MKNRNIQTIEEIKMKNSACGYCFFSKDTMSFFASKVLWSVYHVTEKNEDYILFITSEKSGFNDSRRRYKVRVMKENGQIKTLAGDFSSAREAHSFAKTREKQQTLG